MQDKRFYPYLFLHAGIVTLWVILDRIHKGIANDGVINLLSIAVLLCYFNLLYLHVMTSRRNRHNDIPAKNQVDIFLDNMYPDKYLDKVYNNKEEIK